MLPRKHLRSAIPPDRVDSPGVPARRCFACPRAKHRFFTGFRPSQSGFSANQPGKRFSLTAEQLEAARSERMRHNGHAAMQYEDVRTWIEETGLCLFLPRSVQAGFTAPTFVEAVAGQRVADPHLDLIASSEGFLIRLEAEGVAVRLSLNGQPGDQPDYVVASWVLPYVYALRGDRDWRRPPQLTGSRQVSPLAVQVAKQLESGNQSAPQLRDALGREVTEAATLRALHELWRQLRVIPVVPAHGKPALWQPLRQRFQKAIAEGASTSQVTAISVLASIYLQAVIAASMEDIEMFLSALTSRSKIREVVRGLAATRQVHTTSVGQLPLYYVAGTLPEFPAEPSFSISGSSYLHRYPRPVDDFEHASDDSISLAAFAERQSNSAPKNSEFAASRSNRPAAGHSDPTQRAESGRAGACGNHSSARPSARPHAAGSQNGSKTSGRKPAESRRCPASNGSGATSRTTKKAARIARPASTRFQSAEKPSGITRKRGERGVGNGGTGRSNAASLSDRGFRAAASTSARKPARPGAAAKPAARPGTRLGSSRPSAKSTGSQRPADRPSTERRPAVRRAESAPRSSASRRFSLVGASARNSASRSKTGAKPSARNRAR